MTTLVLTVIGDDRSGLVSTLSGVIAQHGGSWERSQMARLAGKFAGIVMVSVPDDRADALIDALEPLGSEGVLDVTVGRSSAPGPEVSAGHARLTLELLGADRPGIVRDITRVLAHHGVSIEELHTDTRPAPMSGEMLFEARAVMTAPASVPMGDLRAVLEELANELMVDIGLGSEHDEASGAG